MLAGANGIVFAAGVSWGGMLDFLLAPIPASLVLAGILAAVIGGALMALQRARRPAPLPGFLAANLVAVGVLLVLGGTFGPAAETAEAQESSPDGAYDEQSGLITPSTSGSDVRIVTTDMVPGQSCVALDSDAAAGAGANAVLGLRTATFVNRQGNPRLFLYGTLALCE